MNALDALDYTSMCGWCTNPGIVRSWVRDRNYASLSWECPSCGDYSVIPYTPEWNDDDDDL